MGVYAGGGSGSGDTHVSKVISGGATKSTKAKKAMAKKAGIAAKKASAKTSASPIVNSVRAAKIGNIVTPRMRRSNSNPQM